MSSPFDIWLTPPTWGEAAKPFVLGEEQWCRAVRLVEKTGPRMNSFSGLTRGDAATFGRSLSRALEQEVIVEPDRSVLLGLAKFLVGRGAAGVTLTKSYRRWDRF